MSDNRESSGTEDNSNKANDTSLLEKQSDMSIELKATPKSLCIPAMSAMPHGYCSETELKAISKAACIPAVPPSGRNFASDTQLPSPHLNNMKPTTTWSLIFFRRKNSNL